MSTCKYCKGSGWVENKNRQECDNCMGRVCYMCENRREQISCKWIPCSICDAKIYSESLPLATTALVESSSTSETSSVLSSSFSPSCVSS